MFQKTNFYNYIQENIINQYSNYETDICFTSSGFVINKYDLDDIQYYVKKDGLPMKKLYVHERLDEKLVIKNMIRYKDGEFANLINLITNNFQ